MQTEIIKLINDFEHGRMSRRQLIAHLTGIFAATVGATIAFADQQTQLATPRRADSTTTFDATDLNHIALSVSDIQRSEKWYQKHLGLKATEREGFLTTGKGWLAPAPPPEFFSGASGTRQNWLVPEPTVQILR